MPSVLATTLIQSTLLNAFSNILAQVIDQYQKNKPFSLNILALLQFITYAIIIVPINFSWQKYVEARYPGFPRSIFTRNATTTTTTSHNGNSDRSPSPTLPSSSINLSNINASSSSNQNAEDLLPRKEKPALQRKGTAGSGLRNFVIKFTLDQTVGSVMNIVLFVVLINLLKGVAWPKVWGLVCEDFRPIMIARLKYRPVVSVLLYTVVPLERRVVFGSACGVIWGVYLSLYAVV